MPTTSEVQVDFERDMLRIMTERFTSGDCSFEGVSVSAAYREFRQMGWKNLGCLSDFEDACERFGFVVISARNFRNQKCRAVTL